LDSKQGSTLGVDDDSSLSGDLRLEKKKGLIHTTMHWRKQTDTDQKARYPFTIQKILRIIQVNGDLLRDFLDKLKSARP